MGSSVCLKRKQKVSISNHCKNTSLIVLINQMLIAFKFQSALKHSRRLAKFSKSYKNTRNLETGKRKSRLSLNYGKLARRPLSQRPPIKLQVFPALPRNPSTWYNDLFTSLQAWRSRSYTRIIFWDGRNDLHMRGEGQDNIAPRFCRFVLWHQAACIIDLGTTRQI